MVVVSYVVFGILYITYTLMYICSIYISCREQYIMCFCFCVFICTVSCNVDEGNLVVVLYYCCVYVLYGVVELQCDGGVESGPK